MTDIAITPANVLAGTGAMVEDITAGATITAGQVVYREGSTGKAKLADCDSDTAEARSPRGIALNGASDGQPLEILREGPITIGATLTPGTVYYLSATAGGICPVGDLGQGDYPVVVGIARSASVLHVKFLEAQVALAA